MAVETKKTFCRFCQANCALEVDVEDGRAVALRGDASNPIHGGYTCMKGRELIAQHAHPERIRTPLKREGEGFAKIPAQQAFDEIAAELQRILEAHGPRAVATYNGSYAFQNLVSIPVSRVWHHAIGSPSYYTSVTLDQPAKVFMGSRFGTWGGGVHSFKDADVVLLLGNNPLVSQYAPVGSIPPFNPSHRLREARKRGTKVIVADPRRTETARNADLHLQLRPGTDPVLLAAMIRLILQEGLHDAAFCARWADGLGELQAAVEPFTLEVAARRTDVPADQIATAARMFAAGPRGAVTTGTGPEMAPRGSLTEHLVQTLNTICARYYGEGDVSAIPRVLTPGQGPRKAQVIPPMPAWGEGFPEARVRGLTQIGGEMPCNVLADEILTPGEGQVRALLCIGGNPMIAFPDQLKVRDALDRLELLVCIDPWMSATSRRAHYILPPKLCLEREDAALLGEWWFEAPYSQYTEAIIEAEGEVIEEWELFWEIARRHGTPLTLPGGALDLETKPSKYEVMEKVTAGSPIPLARVRDEAGNGGQVFEPGDAVVRGADPDADGRFQLGLTDPLRQLGELAAQELDAQGRAVADMAGYSHLLISRRTKQYFNSSGFALEALRERGTTNYAHLHPSDLASLGIASESLVEISAEAGSIVGVVLAADDIKPGCISMAHAFGDVDSDASNVRERGSSTNRLASDSAHFDPITGQARQSAIPVNIRPIAG